MGKKVALLGDPSSHGGKLINTNQDDTVRTAGTPWCVEGCMHACPQHGHGTTPVTAVTVKTYVNGKLVITEGAVAGCGAVIQPPNRNTYVE